MRPARPRLEEPVGTRAELRSDTVLEAVSVDAPGWAATDTEFAELLQVALHGGSLADAQLYRTRWTDVEVVGSDLANLVFRESIWSRVALERCRATGLMLAGCRIADLTVVDTVAELANWRQARVRRAAFTGCRLAGADFGGAELESVTFDRCDLTDARFAGARLSSVRFVGCTMTGLTGVASLAGARIEPVNLAELAGQFADALGIELVVENDA